jgi:hypothetical protein
MRVSQAHPMKVAKSDANAVSPKLATPAFAAA